MRRHVERRPSGRSARDKRMSRQIFGSITRRPPSPSMPSASRRTMSSTTQPYRRRPWHDHARGRSVVASGDRVARQSHSPRHGAGSNTNHVAPCPRYASGNVTPQLRAAKSRGRDCHSTCEPAHWRSTPSLWRSRPNALPGRAGHVVVDRWWATGRPRRLPNDNDLILPRHIGR